MRLPLTAGRSAATGDLAVGQGTTDGDAAARPAGKAAGQPAGGGQPGWSWPGARRMAAAVLRRHWLISVLLLAGLVLRVLAMIAYRPALLYIDSLKYIFGAWPGNDPLGYNVILKIVLLPGNLMVVAALQHLVGLAMAVTLYLVLLRRRVPRWLAALATAPVLLDAYEIQIEQSIMPNVWFEACIVAGLALLLWRPRPGPRLIVAGGLVLGLSAPMAQVGQIFIVPALAYVLIAVRGWRRKLIEGGLLCAAFLLPIVAFSAQQYADNGHFSLAPASGNTIYGRLASSADCAALNLPSYERAVCPSPALARQLGPDGLVHSPVSPDHLYVAPPGHTHAEVISDFNHRVLTEQPLRVVWAVLRDSVKLFAVGRVTSPGDTPISRWQFQTSYPTYGTSVYLSPDHTIMLGLHYATSGGPEITQPLPASMGGRAAVDQPLASFLRRYQLTGGYTPGPLLALAAAAGLFGSLALGGLAVARGRARPARAGALAERRDAQYQLALACLLVFGAAVAVLLASDAFEFSWRYQLPALVTLPPAGALGIALGISFLRQPKPDRSGGRAAAEQLTQAGGGGPAAPAGGAHPAPAEDAHTAPADGAGAA
jgi:hypothetical protein